MPTQTPEVPSGYETSLRPAEDMLARQRCGQPAEIILARRATGGLPPTEFP